ncbi:MAG: OmpA family protein [Crocinitomix sp.]|nr:OmpA family protein [Crocinitomix sp.]
MKNKLRHIPLIFICVSCFIALSSVVSEIKTKPTSWTPEFYFKFNSIKPVDSVKHIHSWVPSDSLFLDIKQLMIDNPDILILEISGFADSNEKNPKKVSEDRADKIKNELVNRGVDQTRLQTIGYGSTKPRIPTKDILAELDLQKREKLREQNRRVNFKVLKFANPKETQQNQH